MRVPVWISLGLLSTFLVPSIKLIKLHPKVQALLAKLKHWIGLDSMETNSGYAKTIEQASKVQDEVVKVLIQCSMLPQSLA